MKCINKKYIWIVTLSILAASLISISIFQSSHAAQGPRHQISPLEPDSFIWGVYYPNQLMTLLQTEFNDTRTVYGGSEPFSHLEDDPRLLTLFAGYGFSIEYNDDRGHWNTIEDVEGTARVNEKTPGTCYSCKSSNNPSLWQEIGMAEYDSTPFATLGESIEFPIGCANCHDSRTMKLIVTNPALETALEAQGIDWTSFTRQEMRTVVCANCHVEYYFAGAGKYLTFPWVNGQDIEDIAVYYQEVGFTDWTHPDSGAAMIKMQHPDYETFTNDSPHFNAGVACADCHMPYVTGGAQKYSTHDVKSPLLYSESDSPCSRCHKNVEEVLSQVAIIQDEVHSQMMATEDALLAVIEEIELAALAGGDPDLLAQARNLHREAQLRWDFVAAENSMGFHNPDYAMETLIKAAQLAHRAEVLAVRSQD